MQGMSETCKINGVLQMALPMEAISSLRISKGFRMVVHITMIETTARTIITTTEDTVETVEADIARTITAGKSTGIKMGTKTTVVLLKVAPIKTLTSVMVVEVTGGKIIAGHRHVDMTMVQIIIIMVVTIIAMTATATPGTMILVKTFNLLIGTMIASARTTEIDTMTEGAKGGIMGNITTTNVIRGKRRVLHIFYILTCQI